MSDAVTVKTEVHYQAWDTPDGARLFLPVDGVDSDPLASDMVPLEALPIEVVDALAAQWLTHLYAGLNRATPWYREAKSDDH